MHSTVLFLMLQNSHIPSLSHVSGRRLRNNICCKLPDPSSPLSILSLPMYPNPSLSPEEVVYTVCRGLQFNDIPTLNTGDFFCADITKCRIPDSIPAPFQGLKDAIILQIFPAALRSQGDKVHVAWMISLREFPILIQLQASKRPQQIIPSRSTPLRRNADSPAFAALVRCAGFECGPPTLIPGTATRGDMAVVAVRAVDPAAQGFRFRSVRPRGRTRAAAQCERQFIDTDIGLFKAAFHIQRRA